MQNDIVAAATKGPHITPSRVDPVERRAELELVIAAATLAIPKATMKKLGKLSIAEAMDDDDHSYFGQIRSEPVGKSGIEFRYPMPARNTGSRDLEDTIQNVVDGATRVAQMATQLKKYVELMREAANEAIAPASGGISPMRIVAIGITPSPVEDNVLMTVDVEMLGCNLKRGIDRAAEHSVERVEKRLEKLAAMHAERSKVLAQTMVAGGTGWIDDAAVRIIDAAGLPRADILAMMEDERQVEFMFGGEEGYDLMGGVHWEDGTMRGYIENRDRNGTYRLEANQLLIPSKGLPSTIIADLVGRRLREVVDIDAIPPSALILAVEESGEWLYIDLEIGRSLIEHVVPAID
ncbi:hypothetical protein ACM61V_04345 [Sphingomonas sp. TX0543]|uniref:hypothetical protein n=1 Tax=unclassified Sphingomonas TaxID=196159 RepID=UPI0010F73206|nr:hypothetical protein [Sphingomonas sp. 3P27F8]